MFVTIIVFQMKGLSFNVCNRCHDVLVMSLNLNGNIILNINNVDYDFMFNKSFLSCVTNFFRQQLCVVPLRGKIVITITNNFQINIDKGSSKPWVDRKSQINNRSMKSWLKVNDIETHSIAKSDVAEKFIRTLRSHVQKNLTFI